MHGKQSRNKTLTHEAPYIKRALEALIFSTKDMAKESRNLGAVIVAERKLRHLDGTEIHEDELNEDASNLDGESELESAASDDCGETDVLVGSGNEDIGGDDGNSDISSSDLVEESARTSRSLLASANRRLESERASGDEEDENTYRLTTAISLVKKKRLMIEEPEFDESAEIQHDSFSRKRMRKIIRSSDSDDEDGEHTEE